jgi:glycosyltransferase involved in cell wall biosynthesis
MTVWARGKCSFKMLQYMACGIPVVVSPVGMNENVLAMGEIGMGATTIDDWVDTLSTLLKDQSLRLKMGQQGRQVVESYFSLDVIAPKLATLLQQIGK